MTVHISTMRASDVGEVGSLLSGYFDVSTNDMLSDVKVHDTKVQLPLHADDWCPSSVCESE